MDDSIPVIVVGASLGGLDALSRIAQLIHPGFGAPIIAVLHTGSQDPERIVARLASRSVLPVKNIENGQRLEPGVIYLSPPSHRLTIVPRGILRLTPTTSVNGSTADALFLSAARAYGKQAIGVVLSGAGVDGTAGLNAIHQAGGIGIVQRPDEAESSGMPDSAIKGDHPDYTVSVDEIGPLLEMLISTDLSLRPGSAPLPLFDMLQVNAIKSPASEVPGQPPKATH